jgi:hemolysin III
MDTTDTRKPPAFSFALFVVIMGAQVAAVIALYRFAAPTVFLPEWRMPWQIVGWTALMGLPLSLFEYLYHRYLLHASVLPFVSSMHKAHSVHHSLTYVKAPVTPAEPAKLVPVKSAFPVEEEHQEDSMMFPYWAFPIFQTVFCVLLALPLKLVFPTQPVIISVSFAVSLYYCAYEIWHAVLHLPFERFWQPMMESRWLGKLTRRMYSFHLLHHWRPKSNLAIVGFWGVAVWDHAFRTHRRPERLPLKGAKVTYLDGSLAKPLWPIRLLDRWQAGLTKASRATERFLGKVFLGRRTTRS